MFGWLSLIPAIAGAVVAFGIFGLYNQWIDNPRVTAAARREYVEIAQLEAERAKAAELQRQRDAAAQAFEEYRRHLTAALANEVAEGRKQEQLIAEYERRIEAAGRAWLLDEEDKAFLER